MVSAMLSQLSSFACVSRGQRYRLPPGSHPFLRSKVVIVTSNDGRATSISNSNLKTAASYTEDASHLQNGRSLEPDVAAQEPLPINGESEPIEGSAVTEQIRAAKIHDFCLGIPFGGLVLSGGLVGFIVSRNPASLGTGVLFGGGLLGLSILSLKVWRTGKSSLPFMLGQAVLAAVLMWKNVQTYSLKKMIFPAGFYAAISAAMLCFYTYVVMSGGNPPPKKKSSVAIQS